MEIHELQQLLSEMSLQEKIGQMVQLTGVSCFIRMRFFNLSVLQKNHAMNHLFMLFFLRYNHHCCSVMRIAFLDQIQNFP